MGGILRDGFRGVFFMVRRFPVFAVAAVLVLVFAPTSLTAEWGRGRLPRGLALAAVVRRTRAGLAAVLAAVSRVDFLGLITQLRLEDWAFNNMQVTPGNRGRQRYFKHDILNPLTYSSLCRSVGCWRWPSSGAFMRRASAKPSRITACTAVLGERGPLHRRIQDCSPRTNRPQSPMRTASNNPCLYGTGKKFKISREKQPELNAPHTPHLPHQQREATRLCFPS